MNYLQTVACLFVMVTGNIVYSGAKQSLQRAEVRQTLSLAWRHGERGRALLVGVALLSVLLVGGALSGAAAWYLVLLWLDV